MHVIYRIFTANLPFTCNLPLIYKPHCFNSTQNFTVEYDGIAEGILVQSWDGTVKQYRVFESNRD